jgi:hypothetical protein
MRADFSAAKLTFNGVSPGYCGTVTGTSFAAPIRLLATKVKTIAVLIASTAILMEQLM